MDMPKLLPVTDRREPIVHTTHCITTLTQEPLPAIFATGRCGLRHIQALLLPSSCFSPKFKRPWGGSPSYRQISCARVAEAATITAHHVQLSVLSFDSGLWERGIRHQVIGRTFQAWAYTSKRTKEHSDLVRGHASGHFPSS